MGVKLRQAHGTVSIISDERTSIVLYEENQFYALSGVATKKKTGSQANGDSCSMFQLDDGMYHVCVSDGMGSGKQAQAESTLVVDLLEKLLEAGFSRESALKLMNSAMVISAGEESYSTVDFATIDMYTGELELTKTGAAPSFIKSGKQVSVIEIESLPAGVDAAQESKHSKIHFKVRFPCHGDGWCARISACKGQTGEAYGYHRRRQKRQCRRYGTGNSGQGAA